MKNLTAKARKSLPATFDITPKYDGCCAVLVYDGLGRFAGAFSATGEPVPSLEQVGTWIGQHAHSPLRQLALVGEAWMPGTEFPVINGTFRRQSNQPQLRFVPFDCTAWQAGEDYPLLDDGRPYHERVLQLNRLQYSDEYVLPIIHHCGSLADAERIAQEHKAKGGFDGAIVRDPGAPYVVGRSKAEVIKVKPTLSLDLEVLRTDVAPGAKTGRPVYTIVVEYRGVTSFVGSGVPHTLSWAVGDIVEVEAMGLTPDGKLREPRFKGVRYDKTGPDT